MLYFFNYTYIYCLIFKRSLNFFMTFYDFLITIFLLYNSTLYCTGQHCKTVGLSVCSTLFKYI